MPRPPCSSPSHGTPASWPHLCPLPSQLQNLGFFPVEGVTIKLTVPVATRGGNRLLLLTEFMVDQVGARGFLPIKHVWVLPAPGVGMETPPSRSPHPFANPPMLTPARDGLGLCLGFSLFHSLGWKYGKWWWPKGLGQIFLRARPPSGMQ